RMIFNRTLACQMKEAIKQSTTVSISAKANGTEAQLSASGTRIEFPGFIKVYVEGSDEEESEEEVLPKLKEGQILNVSELKKVSWPSFGKVVKQTGVVLVVVLAFLVVITAFDFGLLKLLGLVVPKA
ncbi:MAG: preprotein translocase subunit SecE, partial [Clostridia bacterium]|nr:preprotein translocase subunit SecE [Clostridia bacterium]